MHSSSLPHSLWFAAESYWYTSCNYSYSSLCQPPHPPYPRPSCMMDLEDLYHFTWCLFISQLLIKVKWGLMCEGESHALLSRVTSHFSSLLFYLALSPNVSLPISSSLRPSPSLSLSFSLLPTPLFHSVIFYIPLSQSFNLYITITSLSQYH